MFDKKIQMMDAGMRLFDSPKPFGTVLGGMKTEMAKHGTVLRPNEINPANLPETTGVCDLFLDWSSPLKKRYLSCRIEDAGIVGKTDEGEEIHRYAVTFKEGHSGIAFRKEVRLATDLLNTLKDAK